MRFEGTVEPRPAEARVAASVTGGRVPPRRIGVVHLPIGDLEVYWIDVYGGGVFLPFRDLRRERTRMAQAATCSTPSRVRRLLGSGDRSIVLDFNYAYHPSCA